MKLLCFLLICNFLQLSTSGELGKISSSIFLGKFVSDVSLRVCRTLSFTIENSEFSLNVFPLFNQLSKSLTGSNFSGSGQWIELLSLILFCFFTIGNLSIFQSPSFWTWISISSFSNVRNSIRRREAKTFQRRVRNLITSVRKVL